jgi:hypothetical protein
VNYKPESIELQHGKLQLGNAQRPILIQAYEAAACNELAI